MHGGIIGYQHGGVVGDDMIPAAQHGWMIQVGEAGKETVILPAGSQVMPHTASKGIGRGLRGGGEGTAIVNNFHTPIHEKANNPTEFANAMRSYMMGQYR